MRKSRAVAFRSGVATLTVALCILALGGIHGAGAEVVIADAPRPSGESSNKVVEKAREQRPALTHEAFTVRGEAMEGFIINTSDETIRDVLVEIRGTSADQLVTFWVDRAALGDMEPGQRTFVRKPYPEWFPKPEKIVFDFDPPEDPNTPWPRPVQIENIRYTGSGTGLTSWFTLNPGAVRFAFVHTGTGDFALELKPLGSTTSIPLARHSGEGEGASLYTAAEQGVYQLQVRAAGDWQVRIREEGGRLEAAPADRPKPQDEAQAPKPRPIRIEERDSGDIRIMNK